MQYREITHQVDTLLTTLADMNSQTLQLIEANDFAVLKAVIDTRLQGN